MHDRSRRISAFCLALFLAATAPALAEDQKRGSQNVSILEIDGVQTYKRSDGDRRIEIRSEGEIEFTPDWTGIARLSRGAEMRFEEEKDGAERRLDVEPGNDGSPVYTWKIDGKERPFDAEGRKWLQEMLLQYVRGTGYDAEKRVAWFLKRQGPQGVLSEISQIPGDYVARIYFGHLFKNRLEAQVVQRALEQAGREIGSDYELRQALVAAANSQALAGASAQAYTEAARSIGSDFEQRNALSALLEKGRLDPRILTAALQSAREIGSDFELATLLVEAAKKTGLGDPAVRRAYVEAVGEIGSDFEQRRALSAMAGRGDLSPEALLAVLQAAQGIGSDFEQATLLVEIA
ncbi:MAG TPA: hypothetical protein VIW92_16290, partial [Thermoanaerobaculia bacterium]